MPRVAESTRLDKVQFLAPGRNPSIFKGATSFRVNRVFTGTDAVIDKTGLLALTQKFKERADKNPALKDSWETWKDYVGYEEKEMDVDVPIPGAPAVPPTHVVGQNPDPQTPTKKEKKKVAVITRDEVRLDFLIFKKFGWWIKAIVVYPIEECYWDSSNTGLRGFRYLFIGHFDSKPISYSFGEKKKEWIEKGKANFQRRTGKSAQAADIKKLEQEYAMLPKGKYARFYFFPIANPKTRRDTASAALMHAFNEAGLTGFEIYSEDYAKVAGLEASVEGLRKSNNEYEKLTAQLTSELTESRMVIQQLQLNATDRMTPILPGRATVPPVTFADTGGNSDFPETKKKPLNIPWRVILALLAITGGGALMYTGAIYQTVAGIGAFGAGMFLAGMGVFGLLYKRKPPQTASTPYGAAPSPSTPGGSGVRPS